MIMNTPLPKVHVIPPMGKDILCLVVDRGAGDGDDRYRKVMLDDGETVDSPSFLRKLASDAGLTAEVANRVVGAVVDRHAIL